MRAEFDKMGVTVVLSPRNIAELSQMLTDLITNKVEGTVPVMRKLQEDDYRIITIAIDCDGGG